MSRKSDHPDNTESARREFRTGLVLTTESDCALPCSLGRCPTKSLADPEDGSPVGPHVLKPFDAREAITTAIAAKRAGYHAKTIRNWCEKDGIGRKVGGVLRVSKVALQMKLEGDDASLQLYQAGDRENPRVVAYFARLGLLDLIRK